MMMLVTVVVALALWVTTDAAASPYGLSDEWDGTYTRAVKLRQGTLVGMELKPHSKHVDLPKVEIFLGVPYADPPVGNMSFMPPGAAPPWQGTRYATRFPPVCPQRLPDLSGNITQGRYNYLKRLLSFLDDQSPDCLYLNIYAPMQGSDRVYAKYPVIVYIHGESFEWNSGNPYDGTTLASFGQVVVVTLNFRLGIYGFLKAGGNTAGESNFGLLDQVAALVWIKQNIQAFGGDASRVTLMGHGTGAVCVSLLLTSPVASHGEEELFKRAVLLSGTALADWALVAFPERFTVQVAQELNCPSNEALLPCVRSKPPSRVAAVRVGAPAFATPFGPVVDGIHVRNDPAVLMGQYGDHFAKYDLLYGVTQSESYHLLSKTDLEEGIVRRDANRKLMEYLSTRGEVHGELTVAEYTVAEILNEYLPDQNIEYSPEERRGALLDILSDARVVAPLVRTAAYHSSRNPRSYFYVFSHRSLAGDYASAKIHKSINGEELSYVFGLPIYEGRNRYPQSFTNTEQQLSEAVMTFWTNFAKTGNPNEPMKIHSEELLLRSAGEEIMWHPYNTSTQIYLDIGIPLRVRDHYRENFIRYWNDKKRRPIKPTEEGYRTTKPSRITVTPKTYQPIRLSFPTTTPSTTTDKTKDAVNDPPQQQHTADNKPEPTESALADSSSVALTIVIIVGICFLLVNLCAFAGLYYQTDRLKLQEQIMRQKYEDMSLNPDERYGGKTEGNADKEKTAGINKSRKKKRGTDDDYEAIRSSEKPAEGEGSARRWRLSRHCSTSTVDPHTKVREWIASEIIQRYSPRFLRRNKDHPLSSPVETSIGTSLDQATSTTTTPNTMTAVHLEHVPHSASDEKQQMLSTLQRAKAKKISVAVDATPAARSASIQRQVPVDMSKSMDELVYVSKSTLTLKKPILKRSATTVEDIPRLSVSPRSSTSTEGLKRSSTTVNLKVCPAESQPDINVIQINHQHSRSDPSPVTPKVLATNRSENKSSTNLQIVDIPLDSSQPSVPQTLKKPLQTFSSARQLRPRTPVEKKDVAITAVPVIDGKKNVNVTSRDSVEIKQENGEDPLSNMQRRNFPKVLPDFPPECDPKQGPVTGDTDVYATNAIKRRSLPLNSYLGVNLSATIHQSGSTSQPPTPTTQDGKELVKLGTSRIPPPPPPRVSTLGRKPSNNAPIAPLVLPPLGDVSPSQHSPTTPTSLSPQIRQEPKIIIKPTITQMTKNPQTIARQNQTIPRVTPYNPEANAVPLHASTTQLTPAASTSGSSSIPVVRQPTSAGMAKVIPNSSSSLPVAHVTTAQQLDTPSMPSKLPRPRAPVSKKSVETSTSADSNETGSNTGTVKRVKKGTPAKKAPPSLTKSTSTDSAEVQPSSSQKWKK